MFSSIPGFSPLGASSTPSQLQQLHTSRHYQMSRGCKITSWLRTKALDSDLSFSLCLGLSLSILNLVKSPITTCFHICPQNSRPIYTSDFLTPTLGGLKSISVPTSSKQNTRSFLLNLVLIQSPLCHHPCFPRSVGQMPGHYPHPHLHSPTKSG